MDLNFITAFLSGSLGTLLIKSIIDYFSKQNDHKIKMQQLTYERKLSIAESAVAFYSHYRYNYFQLQASLEVIINIVENFKEDETNSDIGIIQQNLNTVAKTISEMFGSKYQDVLSMNLYFDFSKNEYYSLENLKAFLATLGKVKVIDSEIEFCNLQYNLEREKGSINLANTYFKSAIEELPKYTEALKELLELIKIDNKGSDEVIKTIKEQLNIFN